MACLLCIDTRESLQGMDKPFSLLKWMVHNVRIM